MNSQSYSLRSLATSDVSIDQLTEEAEHVRLIYEDLNDIKHKFVDIGFRLKEANDRKYYARLGYASIEEFSDDLFDLKKSSVYQLIGIADKFCNKCTRQLRPEYDDYSQSQLVEMLSCSDYEIKKISPDLTVQEIRLFKKAQKAQYGTFGTAREQIQYYLENSHVATQNDERASVKNSDVLPGQTSIFDESEEESYDWRKDYNSKEWREHHYSSLLFDTTDDPNFKAAIINANTEVLLKARKCNSRMTAIKKIESELKRRGVNFDEPDNEIVQRSSVVDISKIQDVSELQTSRRLENREFVYADEKCLYCYEKTTESTFMLDDYINNATFYVKGFKFCPYCGRKLTGA